MRMRVIESEKIEVVLDKLKDASEKVIAQVQKESAKVIKARVVGELAKLKTTETKVHMTDDVQISTGKDSFGNPNVKVRGGKKTGTLWHIVNDGAYNHRTGKRNKATHFMDNALAQSEGEIERILDDALRRELGE